VRTIHIAKGNPNRSDDGSALYPYRIKDGYAFDAIFKANREPTTFILHPGEYFTRGSWAFAGIPGYALLAPNCHLVGANGSEATFLSLDPGYERLLDGKDPGYVETVIGGGNQVSGSNQMVVTGLTIDASAAQVPSSGIHTYSGGTTISDVRVVGVRGTWGAAEGFGILVNDAAVARNGGNRVSGCRVEFYGQGDESYWNGIYLGSVDERGAPNVIENCFVTAEIIPNAKRGHTCFAANLNTTVRNCSGSGCHRWFFCDTANVGNLEITGCRGDYGYVAVDLPAPATAANPIEYRRKIRVTHCTFDNVNATDNHAIAILLKDMTADYNSVRMEDVDVDSCRFSSELPPGMFYLCSIQAQQTKRVWFRNCAWPEGTEARAGIFSPTPQSECLIQGVPTGT